jgi:hypothetical protein
MCPTCFPDLGDDDTYVVWWCRDHEPSQDGAEDSKVVSHGYNAGGAECEGASNKLWNDLLMRGRDSSR